MEQPIREESTERVESSGPQDHVVLFYQRDAELIETAGNHLLQAIRGGGAAVVVGTWQHRLALARLLLKAGIDPAAARANGTYCELDATETIREFLVDGHADAACFWAAITPVIRHAIGHGRPVRIFGEMVAVLWNAGLVNAAIEVEAMWNEVGAQFSFALLCGYPADSVADESLADELSEVCRAHAAVMATSDNDAGWQS